MHPRLTTKELLSSNGCPCFGIDQVIYEQFHVIVHVLNASPASLQCAHKPVNELHPLDVLLIPSSLDNKFRELTA